MLHQIEPPPDITARLEWLDDLMFAAIEGDPVALEAASGAWNKAIGELVLKPWRNLVANICVAPKVYGTSCVTGRITRRTKYLPRSR